MEKKLMTTIPVSQRVRDLFGERKTYVLTEFCQLLRGLSAFYKIAQDSKHFFARFLRKTVLKMRK